jgi:hypothetical protein
MEPLHVVDKLNAISVKLPGIGIDQSRFVTKREKYARWWMVDDRATERHLSHDGDAQYV